MKLRKTQMHLPVSVVAPRRGAWIETALSCILSTGFICRTPQGCVD